MCSQQRLRTPSATLMGAVAEIIHCVFWSLVYRLAGVTPLSSPCLVWRPRMRLVRGPITLPVLLHASRGRVGLMRAEHTQLYAYLHTTHSILGAAADAVFESHACAAHCFLGHAIGRPHNLHCRSHALSVLARLHLRVDLTCTTLPHTFICAAAQSHARREYRGDARCACLEQRTAIFFWYLRGGERWLPTHIDCI